MEQSLGLLSLSLILLGASSRRAGGTVRVGAVALTSLGILGFLVVAPFPTDAAIGMGDYLTYARDPAGYVDAGVRMDAPLGWAIFRVIWTMLGRTTADAPTSFRLLASTFTVVLLIGLNALAFLERWSPRVLRYVALCYAAPGMLLFLGYREFAYLPLAFAATALPLLLLAMERQRSFLLYAAFALLGVGAAVHVLGAITLVASFAAVSVAGLPAHSLRLAALAGLCGWGLWFVGFRGFGIPLVPGHTAHLDLRALFQDVRVEYVSRTKPALFTARGLRDVLAMYALGGLMIVWALVLPVRAVVARVRQQTQWIAVLVILIPCLGAAALIWPIQGLAIDTDIVIGLSPAFYAVAWLVADRPPRTVAVCWALLAISHLLFWSVVQSRAYENH